MSNQYQASPLNQRQRLGSITSINSYESTSNSSIRTSSSSNHIPRPNSTNDLLVLDTRFRKPSRSKLPHNHPKTNHHPLQYQQQLPVQPYQQSYPNMHNYNNTNGRLPRSSSFQSTNSYRPSRNAYLSQKSRSPSMENIAELRRQKMVPNNPSPQHHFQPTRPHSKGNTFTFPNGEVYIPRKMQPNSHTNLVKLQQQQEAQQLKIELQNQQSQLVSEIQQSNLLIPKLNPSTSNDTNDSTTLTASTNYSASPSPSI